MSMWTHVAGTFRINAMYGLTEPINFEHIFGKACTYKDITSEIAADMDEHPENYLPAGSEGTLEMSVWENPNMNSMARYTVSIFGDLRDYTDTEEIMKYFCAMCHRLKPIIRQAVITAYCENGTTQIATMDNLNGEIIVTTYKDETQTCIKRYRNMISDLTKKETNKWLKS